MNPSRSSRMKRLAQVLIGSVLLLPWIIATSTTPPPYHQYEVRGTIARPAGGDLQNFSILLYGLSGTGTYHRLPGSYTPPITDDVRPGLTDSSGAFYVQMTSPDTIDSLKIAVLAPDHEITFGSPIAVGEL